MTVTQTSFALGQKAPDFSLTGVDGRVNSLASFKDAKILVVIFSCNHCPYVRAYEERLKQLQMDYGDAGVQLVAINANDASRYPEDSFAAMVARAQEKGYNFPYLRDEDQFVARAYGATHTPQIFVLDSDRKLRYTGRIDDSWQDPSQVKRRDLRDALDALLHGRPVAEAETPAIGCSVKWAE